LVNPTASLLALLRGLVPTDRAAAGAGTRVQGSLPVAAAHRAGIPTDRRPAEVSVTLDHRGRVVVLSVSTSTAAGNSSVRVSVHTTYQRFGHVRPVHRPV
jgi:hypothetical protein